MENMKHEQNKRACQKRGLIKFDLENAIKLIDGEFHDQIEDDEEDKKGLTLAYKDEGQDPNKTVFAGSLEELKY